MWRLFIKTINLALFSTWKQINLEYLSNTFFTWKTRFHAGVAELADAGDSKSPAFGRVGSSPTFGTLLSLSDLHKSLRLFLYPTYMEGA